MDTNVKQTGAVETPAEPATPATTVTPEAK